MAGVDLHVHSTASDGVLDPAEVVRRAHAVGLSAIALTDHDTVAGVEAAQVAGREIGVEVISACEFSTQASWGELHLLGFFLRRDGDLASFLEDSRAERRERAAAILQRLERLGISLESDAVMDVAGSASIGRPHLARALVQAGHVTSVGEAFDTYLADGGPAFVARRLASVEEVARLVAACGGVTSAAHLKDRATRENVRWLKAAGVDGVEVIHPAHDDARVSALRRLANDFGMLKTGGSDWHGLSRDSRGDLFGRVKAPPEWLARMREVHDERMPG